MSLSDEDKKRIEAEEEYRAKVRQELASKDDPVQKQDASSDEGDLAKPLIKILSLLLIIIIIILMQSVGCFRQEAPEDKARRARQREARNCNSEPTMALMMAQEIIKPTLKAPATAKFARPSDSTIVNIGDCTYKVRSYVDAENSFGANLRNHFTATIKYTGNDNWRLLKNTFH